MQIYAKDLPERYCHAIVITFTLKCHFNTINTHPNNPLLPPSNANETTVEPSHFSRITPFSVGQVFQATQAKRQILRIKEYF